MKKIILIILMFISTMGFSQLIPEYQYDSVKVENKLNIYNNKIKTCETIIIVGTMFVYVGTIQHLVFNNDNFMRNMNNTMIFGGFLTAGIGSILLYTYVNKRHNFRLSVGSNNLSLLINF